MIAPTINALGVRISVIDRTAREILFDAQLPPGERYLIAGYAQMTKGKFTKKAGRTFKLRRLHLISFDSRLC